MHISIRLPEVLVDIYLGDGKDKNDNGHNHHHRINRVSIV